MRKDERGASTRPDARMTCEGDTSKVESEDVAGARARSHGTTATKLNKKPTCLYRTCKGSTP